ncbi:MAG TPA: HAD-IIIA family hydrolase [Casimicrobiaceae bacterium]|nr:HAD-IIIA family hydrolase [Casimicrobiaceae bacterium]
MRSSDRNFDLIVFDWDGTLADSTAIIAGAIQAACRDVGEAVPDATSARFVIGLGLRDALAHVAPTLAPERHSELSARYRDHYLARDAEIPLFEGAQELLQELVDAGYLIAVATGKSRVGLDRALVANALADRFHATRCADEGKPKPHPDMLLHLIAQLRVTAARTLMIGDTTHDLEVARGAGAASVAVAHGAHASTALLEAGPLAVVHSLSELRQWLEANG